ncbi:MAG: RDD family protein [Planctomycetaceae bacterium]|nr:RDD family protein [Planctomycetaceae bacterium]MCB9936992.1 RDD family protein [Planctomycetaceae bacterium]
MATKSAQIDSTVEIVTPENIAFHYQVAGPFRRLPAFILDLLIRSGVFTLFMIILGLAGALTNLSGIMGAGMMIVWFLLDWFYGGIFETWMNGQTPGKWVLGIRVLSVDGQPINGIQAIMRNILRTLDMMPVGTCMLGLVAMTLNQRFQRIGDIVCGTNVVVEERKWLTGVAKMDDARVAQLANYIPADYRVSRTLAKTLAAYVDRRRFFSIPRRREVSRHLAEPLLVQFGFPLDTSYDLLLCALYYRTFVADRSDDERITTEINTSPFSPTTPTNVAAQASANPFDIVQPQSGK